MEMSAVPDFKVLCVLFIVFHSSNDKCIAAAVFLCCYQEAIFWWISWKSETIQIYLRSLFHQNPSLFNKILQGAITFEIIARILNEAGDLFKIQLNFMIIFWGKFLTLFVETRFYDFQIFWSWRLCLEDSLATFTTVTQYLILKMLSSGPCHGSEEETVTSSQWTRKHSSLMIDSHLWSRPRTISGLWRLVVTRLRESSVLFQIKYVSAQDAGSYECQVSTVPKMSRRVELVVVVPKVIIN